MSTISSRTRRSLHQLERGRTSMVSADDDGEMDDRSTNPSRPKSKKRKVKASTADTPSSTG